MQEQVMGTGTGGMDPHLTAVAAFLEQAQLALARFIDDTTDSEVERQILATAAKVTAQHRPRTRAATWQFTQAINAGTEAWMVIRSVPGEHRTEAYYFEGLPDDLREILDLDP